MFLVCLAIFGAVTGLVRFAGGVGVRVYVLRHFEPRASEATDGQGCGHAKSTALKAASSDPPYKEAYGYARDTENRLANQLAIGLAEVKAAVKETNELLEKNTKESKELVEKTVERTNLISFLGFALLAVLASMQPELRVLFSLFLSKIK